MYVVVIGSKTLQAQLRHSSESSGQKAGSARTFTFLKLIYAVCQLVSALSL